MSAAVPVLDVGGTHVTAALVDPDAWRVIGPVARVDVDGQADAEQILDRFAAAGALLPTNRSPRWAVAMPDPFDYPRGVGRFHGVGKFESLDGVDVGKELLTRLPGPSREVVFCNDADAFALGEWVAGAGAGHRRVVGLTFGTGVGSGWVDAGAVVVPRTPAEGRAHRLTTLGAPLEDTMSRRALLRAYRGAGGDPDADVREIAVRARDGEAAARRVLADALGAAGAALAGPIREFGADVVVVGGSMSRSWDLFGTWLRAGAGSTGLPPTRTADDPDGAPLVGAAYVAAGASAAAAADDPA